jgi:hypothetical protein
VAIKNLRDILCKLHISHLPDKINIIISTTGSEKNSPKFSAFELLTEQGAILSVWLL